MAARTFVEVQGGYARFDPDYGHMTLDVGEVLLFRVQLLTVTADEHSVQLTDPTRSTKTVRFRDGSSRQMFLSNLRQGGASMADSRRGSEPVVDRTLLGRASSGVGAGLPTTRMVKTPMHPQPSPRTTGAYSYTTSASNYPVERVGASEMPASSSASTAPASYGRYHTLSGAGSAHRYSGPSPAAAAAPSGIGGGSRYDAGGGSSSTRPGSFPSSRPLDARGSAIYSKYQQEMQDLMATTEEDMRQQRLETERQQSTYEEKVRREELRRKQEAEKEREARRAEMERRRREEDQAALRAEQERRERDRMEKEREALRAEQRRRDEERAKAEELARIQAARAQRSPPPPPPQAQDSTDDEDEQMRMAIRLSLEEANAAGTAEPAASSHRTPSASAAHAPPTDDELLDFEQDRELGQGGQGTLFLCHTTTGKPFVLKRITCKTETEKNDFYHRALDFCFNVRHAGIIEYYNVQEDPTDPMTVVIRMPWYNERDLEFYINEAPRRGIDQRIIVDYTKQIAATLRYLHSLVVKRNGREMPMVHRDLKPANILLCENRARCILIDFDSWGRTGKNTIAGTEEYTAPERLGDNGEAAPASDVWSLGAILFILLTLPDYPMLEDPRDPSNVYFLNHDYWDTPGVLRQAIERKLPQHYDQGLVDLCVEMLHHDPQRRPSAVEVERRCKTLLGR